MHRLVIMMAVLMAIHMLQAGIVTSWRLSADTTHTFSSNFEAFCASLPTRPPDAPKVSFLSGSD